ncbi:MAG: FMN-binding protein, partial [Bacteroidales bacterium]|nr:FMN-binding protein [Bacteroidales bacterium]
NSLRVESEYFDYFILFDAAKTVELVRVFNYQASHGQEVTAPGWLRQFVGYGGQEGLVVGREIDAISGATISADGITMDLQKRCRDIRKFAI